MIPILLRIGPITIYSYGCMVALAFIVGGWLVTREFDRRGYSPELASRSSERILAGSSDRFASSAVLLA
jgi:phosphatidylglycerol---prolipoprotein diacylglyceryl transferase